MLYVSFHVAGPSVERGIAQFRFDNVAEDAQFMLPRALTPEELGALEDEFGVTIEQRFTRDVDHGEATLRVLQETSKVNLPEIIEGGPLASDGDLLLDPMYAAAHGVEIGDSLVLEAVEYRVVGFFTVPDYTYVLKSNGDLLNQPRTFGIAMIGKSDFEAMDSFHPLYAVMLRGADAGELQRTLHERFTLVHWLDREDNSRIQFVNGDVQAFTQIGTMMPISVLLVTCALIAVVLWRLITSELVQIGTLYALGYRRRTIVLHYMQFPLWVSLIGGVIGTSLGFLLSRQLMASFSIQYNLPSFGMQLSWSHLVIGILLPLALLTGAAWLVIRRALRHSPLQLMRGDVSGGKVGWLERRLRLRRLRFDTRFRFREIVRNVPRSLVMTVGIVFSSMMLLLGFVTIDSMNSLIRDQFEEVYQFNYQYTYQAPVALEVEDGEKASLSPYTLDGPGADDAKVILYGIEPGASLLRLVDSEGRTVDFTEVTITRQLADTEQLRVGDRVTMTSDLSGETVTLPVERIAEVFNGPYVYLPLDEFNELQGWPPGSFMQVMSLEPLTLDPAPSTVELKQDIIDGYASMIDMIYGFIGAIAVIAGCIAVILISVITSMIIEENRGTISMMKVLGYPKKKIRSLILNANSVLVVLGYVLSIPLILGSMDVMFSQFTREMNLVIPAKMAWWSMVVGFVIIWVAYDLARRISRRSIEHIAMAESLKSRAE